LCQENNLNSRLFRKYPRLAWQPHLNRDNSFVAAEWRRGNKP
jgi:hypothetical protein